MKKLFLLILASFFLLSKDASYENGTISLAEKDAQKLRAMKITPVANYPLKTAAYWTSPVMRRADARNLAQHDLVIVDLENKFNNRQILLELKKLNPHIILLVYSNPMEIFLTKYNNRPWQNQVIDEIINNRQAWILKTIDYQKKSRGYAQFWPNMVVLNMSAACPLINGQKYYQWMAEKIGEEILSDPIFDGYFQDNGTVNIAWVYKNKKAKIDISNKGKLKKDFFIDRQWSKGVNRYLKIISRYGQKRDLALKNYVSNYQKMIIVSNKGDLNLLRQTEGKFFENFPNSYLGETWAYGWRQSMSNAQKTGPYTILQVKRGDLEFGLASALLLDNVYLAIGQDDAGIFPEFNINTGKVLGPIRSQGKIFTREYENIRVRVEPLKRKGEIIYKNSKGRK